MYHATENHFNLIILGKCHKFIGRWQGSVMTTPKKTELSTRFAKARRHSSKGRMSSRDKVSGQFLVKKIRVSNLAKIGFSEDEIHKLVVPARTLGRRTDKLNLEESDKVQRLERVLSHAIRVLGSSEKANRWLRKPNRALEQSIPIELLISETGARQVEEILGRIEHGMFS
jgi:putative toxin-antitoxin system antitoxin component (TIGR02293 family)